MQDVAAESRLEQNMDREWAPFWYTRSFSHGLAVSLAHGGAGLGTCWGRDRALTMLDESGFVDLELHEGDDGQTVLYVARAYGPIAAAITAEG